MKLIKLFCVAALLMCTSIAYAEPANVLRGEGLFVCLDADGVGAYFLQRYQRVETNSDTGDIMYMAHGECFGTLPERGAVHWSDQNTEFICSNEAPYFQMVLTRNGNTSLKCQNWPFD